MCYQSVDPGNCSESNIAFYYDIDKRVCSSFVYTGCGGNDNRFNSAEQCERQCGMFRGQGEIFLIIRSFFTLFGFLDICNLERDSGPCRGYFIKYYYDKNNGRCEQFAYGGCGGNGNRFSSTEECEHICVTHEERKPNINSTGKETSLVHENFLFTKTNCPFELLKARRICMKLMPHYSNMNVYVSLL